MKAARKSLLTMRPVYMIMIMMNRRKMDEAAGSRKE